jgi:hypothetical protein
MVDNNKINDLIKNINKNFLILILIFYEKYDKINYKVIFLIYLKISKLNK